MDPHRQRPPKSFTVTITGQNSVQAGTVDAVQLNTSPTGNFGTPAGTFKNASSVTVVSDTQITSVAPSNPAGTTVHIQVKLTQSGITSWSIANPADQYSYIQGKPTVTHLNPFRRV